MTRIHTRPDKEEGESDDPFGRPRGILTPDDRKYLLGEKEELSPQAQRDTRYRIRNRVKNAIWDFHLLLHFQEQRDREKVFSEVQKESVFIQDILAYIYMGLIDHESSVDDSLDSFSQLLEAGIRQGLNLAGNLVGDVEVTIDAEAQQPSKSTILDKINSKNDDPNELIYLFQKEDLTEKEQRVIRKRLLEHVMKGNLTIRFNEPDDGEMRELSSDDAQSVLEEYEDLASSGSEG